MAYNGSGTFLINTAGQPVVAGTVISSTTFNSLTADLATGLSTVITKDGQTTVTANIPMATYKFTGLGVGSAATDSATLSQVQSTVTKLLAGVSGADTVTATASPTLTAYAAGQMFYFVAAGDNTTSVTLNIDALGAKAVTRDGSVALAAADIKSGEVVVVVYDGTRFQVVSQLNSAGDARFANVSIASSLYVGGVSTFVGNAGFSANVSITSALNVGGVATFSAGTAAAPSITTTGDTNTGIFFPAADTISASTAGVERLRVTSAGSVGIGTASPLYQVQIQRRTGSTITAPLLNLQSDNITTDGDSFVLFGTQSANWAAGVDQADSNKFRIEPATTLGAATGLTITTAGNFGIGTTAPQAPFGGRALQLGTTTDSRAVFTLQSTTSGRGSVYFSDGTTGGAAYVGYLDYDHSIDAMLFGTGATERCRIDSSGNLLVGTTSNAGYGGSVVSKSAADTNPLAVLNPSATNPYGLAIGFTGAAPNDATRLFLGCVDNAATRAQIRSNGGLANYSANDVNLSDERTKKNIAPLGSMWNKFKAIEIVTFKYKDQTHDDDNIGVIAQQVESVAPEFVDVDGWGDTPEDGVPFKTVYTTDMYHAAIKALQEAMARIETLEAKVTALESK